MPDSLPPSHHLAVMSNVKIRPLSELGRLNFDSVRVERSSKRKRALCWLRSGVARLRRNRVIVVVSDILTANHDRISSSSVVARPAEDAGANASFKDNKATGGVTSSARDGGIEIDGGVSAP